MKVMTFSKLYNTTKFNKTKFWNIFVEEKHDFSTIIITYGIVDDNKIYSIEYKIYNNEYLNHYQNALIESKNKWNTKIKNGFEIL